MNSSQFMDKQIMGLSGSPNADILDFLNPQEEQNGAGKKEEILPSYDFQPIRPIQALNLEGSGLGGGRTWNSADSKTSTSGFRVSLDSSKVGPEKERGTYDAIMLSEFDRTMKKYADNLLQALEGVSARMSQMETRTHRLEGAIDDLKVTLGNHHGSNDGKLRQLENMLREVQTTVQFLRDKQEIVETQLHLSTLQVSKRGDLPAETSESTQAEPLQRTILSMQPPSSPPTDVHHPASLPSPPNVSPPLPPQQHSVPPPGQHSNQLTQSQISSAPSLPRESYFPPPTQPPDMTQPPYQMPPQQPPPHQPYQVPISQNPSYTQLPQLPQQPPASGSSQLQPHLTHHPDEHLYMPPPGSYLPNVRPPLPAPLSQPPSGSPPSQQFLGPNSQMHESSGNRSGSGPVPPFPGGYGQPPSGSCFSDPYPYGGSHYGNSLKQPPHTTPPPASGSSYPPRVPTAQLLPHALPTASSVSSGSSSSGAANRVPIDDVVDKVTTMGFSRDQVRATVRKLTENGQSVDLNVVLDKLMNDGEIQPQKGWFGR